LTWVIVLLYAGVVLIEIDNSTQIPTIELKAVICAVMAKALFAGLTLPKEVRVQVVPDPIIALNGDLRSGELRLYDRENFNDHTILVYDQGYSQTAQSLFHELCHLMRVFNEQNSPDEPTEESQNLVYMATMINAVEWLASVLILDQQGALRSIHESDPGVSPMVCEGNYGDRVGLPVPQNALEAREGVAQT
jgi:hypothetical protein